MTPFFQISSGISKDFTNTPKFAENNTYLAFLQEMLMSAKLFGKINNSQKFSKISYDCKVAHQNLKILFKNKSGKKRFSIPNKCNQQKKETTGDFFMHLFRSK